MKQTPYRYSKKNIEHYLYSSNTHLDGFNSMFKYLVKLRRDQTIDDEIFGKLVKMAASLFVESEISERIEHAVESRINPAIMLGLRK